MNIHNKRALLEAALFIHLQPSFNFSRRWLFRNRRAGNRFWKKNNESVLETNKLTHLFELGVWTADWRSSFWRDCRARPWNHRQQPVARPEIELKKWNDDETYLFLRNGRRWLRKLFFSGQDCSGRDCFLNRRGSRSWRNWGGCRSWWRRRSGCSGEWRWRDWGRRRRTHRRWSWRMNAFGLRCIGWSIARRWKIIKSCCF